MDPVYSPTFKFFVHARQDGQKNDLVEKVEAVAIDLQNVASAMVDAQGFAEVVDIGDVAVRVADVARRINGGADGRKPVIIERTEMGVNLYVTGFFPYYSIFLNGEIAEILRYAIQDHAITASNEDYYPVKIKAFRRHLGRAPGFRFSYLLPVINIQTILENLRAGLTFRCSWSQ
jgi:hypothetical protein